MGRRGRNEPSSRPEPESTSSPSPARRVALFIVLAVLVGWIAYLSYVAIVL